MSMSCSISSTVTSLGQRRDRVEDVVPLGLGHAGGRLVEQQHARPAGDRERDLQQALLAVGQRCRCARPSRRRDGSARGCRPIPRSRSPFEPTSAPPLAAELHALGDREPDGFERRQVGEQLVDLEGARDAELHALVRLEIGDVAGLRAGCCPAVGRSTPVSRLMIVVLPAPFGPISAWRAPFSTESETSFGRDDAAELLGPVPWSRAPGASGSSGLRAKRALQAACSAHGALGDRGRDLQDVRPRDPEHQDQHDGEDDAVHERQLQDRCRSRR